MKPFPSLYPTGRAFLAVVCLPVASAAAADHNPERLTVTVSATWKGDYSKDYSGSGVSVTETDHVESTCSATLSRTAPAGTSLARMTNRNVDWTCTVSGKGSGTETGKGL
jgi:opacity protein-like surface antigen